MYHICVMIQVIRRWWLPGVFSMLLPCGMYAQPHPYNCQHWRTLNGPGISTSHLRELNPSTARSDSFDILHYNIQIDLTDISGKTIKAATNIRFKPLIEGQSHILFDFFHQDASNQIKLSADSVKTDSLHLGFSHKGNLLQVDFPESLPLNQEIEITVYYQGIPHRDTKWGGFINEQGYIYNLGIGISSIPPNFGKVWYPCFDSFSERATYTYHVKSSGNYKAHCQGEFLGEQVVSGDTVVRSYAFTQPIPTHISAIAASNYEDVNFVHSGVYGPVDVRLTAKPSDTAKMRTSFSNIGKAIDACEFWYGANHWGRVGYVTTTMGALEIPQNIAYPVFMLGQPASVNENLYAHELAHYWWGDWIAPYSHNDMWLKEGPAEYSSHLMTEALSGRQAFVKAVKENQYYVLTEAHVKDKGFWPLSPVPDSVVYGSHTYYKGAAVMHNLRAYLGDTLFRKGMRGVQQSMQLTTFTPEQFRDTLAASTGVALDDFFNDQVFTPGFAVFVSDSMHSLPLNNNWECTIYLRQLLRKRNQFYHNVPLDITLFGENNQISEHTVYTGNQLDTIVLSLPFEPVNIILNRYNRLDQARMEHEFIMTPQQSIPSVVPFVNFRIFKEALSDTARIRIEHIWAGADTSLKANGIDRISSSHYWVVSGSWPENARLAAQLNYVGAKPDDLDYDLFQKTESRAILVYRPDVSAPWRVCNDFTVTAGSLTNGAGSIRINRLLPGHYAFAKGDKLLSLHELPAEKTLQVYPNPAENMLYIDTKGLPYNKYVVEIVSLNGSVCMQEVMNSSLSSSFTMAVNQLSNGIYLLRLRSFDNQEIRQARFAIIR